MILFFLLLAFQLPVFASRAIGVKKLQDFHHKSGVLGNYKALIIGIDFYPDPDIPHLKTAANDARSLAKLLAEQYGFETTLLLNKKATRANIYKALRDLAANTRNDDSVLLYYAGHGDLDRQYNDGWWIPSDARGGDPLTYLDNTQVQKAMRAMKARHVLLVSDSCYSGTLFGRARSVPPVIDERYYLNLYNEKSRWGMTSGNKEPVEDSGTNNHSIFAYQLIKALEQNDKNYLSTQDLYTRIAPIVANNSEQTPLCRPIRNTGDQGGEFVFIRVAGGTPDDIISDAGPKYNETLELGILKVTSSPSGAELEVDGKPAGRTPTQLGNMQVGTVKVTVSKNGYLSEKRNARIKAGRRSVVHIDLVEEKRSGWLSVDTRPSSARVRILNINPRYVRGMELEAGSYHVEVSAPDYISEKRWIELAAGDDIIVEFSLDKKQVAVKQVKYKKKEVSANYTDRATGMEFVAIPGGCFQMGQTEDEKKYLIKKRGKEKYEKYYNDELPRHRVCVDGFSMARHEVTVGQWRRFIKDTGYKTEAERDVKKKGCWSLKDNKWGYHDGRDWENPGFSQKDKQPVACVSHNDVEKYIDWLNRSSFKKYRLPTEAEWEYAARGGTSTIRFWGDGESKACSYANVADKGKSWRTYFPCDDGYKFSSPVGNYRPNSFGLYDMLGNVWEWTSDWYGSSYYGNSPRQNPQGPGSGSSRVGRGGCWSHNPSRVRVADRGRLQPWERNAGMGFRLVLPPGQ